MLQFYFLSVLLNISTGLILVYAADFSKDALEKDNGPESAADGGDDTDSKLSDRLNLTSDAAFFNTFGFRLILGLLTVFTGLMKLLSVVHNDIPVIGDLLPAAAGFAGGFTLLLEYYMVTSTTEVNISESMQKVFIDGRKYIGIFCILAGLLHFLFPQVLLL